MKRWRIPLIIVIGLIVTVYALRWPRWQAQRKREANYQVALKTYSTRFQPGATRKTIEEYLRNEGTSVGHVFGSESPNAISDWVRIGREPGPWYCDNTLVYVVFDFTRPNKQNPLVPQDSDSLQKVRLLKIGESCL